MIRVEVDQPGRAVDAVDLLCDAERCKGVLIHLGSAKRVEVVDEREGPGFRLRLLDEKCLRHLAEVCLDLGLPDDDTRWSSSFDVSKWSVLAFFWRAGETDYARLWSRFDAASETGGDS